MAQTATGLTKEQLEALRKDLLSKGLMLNPDGTVTAVKTGNKTLDESYTKASEEYNAKLLEKGKADNKIAKTAEIGNTAMNVAGGVLGLGQLAGGAKILGKTKAPKYPYEQLPNQQLSARLGDVQRLSQIGDPIIREKMMRDMAMQNAKNDAVAKVSSGGDVASYAAQSQVNSSANNDAIRNIGASELAFKTQQGGILDGLIAQKIQEDNARQKGKIDKFGIDYNEFKAKRNYGEQLVNKGIGNVFNAGIGAGQNATVLARTKQNEALFDAQTPKVLTEQQLAMSTSKVVPTPLPLPQPEKQIGLGLGQQTPPIAPVESSLLNPISPNKSLMPKWVNKAYKKGDMSYMGTPEGYEKYLSKVSKFKANQVYNEYKNKINPLTGKMYSTNDVAVLLKSMTDGNIGANHRIAQNLINKFGL